ncbi:UDP-N-acetylmuramoyl-L-alanine--D-glutamate ligase [Wolbachia endosymbiont of Ctenocephalides felis wCfeT]|uniref:UDP-N-acetylmuramoyl-L-alanine--D-glutamate ligase n=1 Tax=Wolbachia endosymbiont of Ctenocephalides felis wCfeT TaxID=2732593 RepID=UPI00144885C0|nr:UDP-N-acetylmuramoyl-L-alanine--D-glutamate ligase [Wolbachia endosymbiont of Ctenocephalides felis wCfeT]
MHFQDQSIAVFGLGKTGLSVINFLTNSGARVYAWDDCDEQIANAKVIYKKCNFVHPKEYNWNEVTALILSPGIPLYYPEPHWIVKLAKRFNCKIKSDIELFLEAKAANQKIVGVTGTNGKSTTTSLIGHILKFAGKKVGVGGNLGTPVLNLNRDAEIYVIELSSFQLELMNTPTVISACSTATVKQELVSSQCLTLGSSIWTKKIDIAVLLNITPDHIDRHGSMENYIAAKSKLIEGSNIAVIGCDNEITANIFNKFTGNKIPVSASMPFRPLFLSSQCSDTGIQENLVKLELSIEDAKINLTSNAENIASAYAVCGLLGVSQSAIIDSMKSFSGLRHRNELLGKIKNVLFVNDSKATNAESSEKAILSYENIYWIVGGRSKEGGIESLSKYFHRIKKAFLIGESATAFASVLKGKVDLMKCDNLENAFKLACKDAFSTREEVTILLSPACASFDQWKHFEERGEAFCNMFEKLKDSFTITHAI